MPKKRHETKEMRFKLLQEAVWENGDKLNVVIEHVESLELHLTRLIYLLKGYTQRLEILLYGNKPKEQKRKSQRTSKHKSRSS